MKMRTHNICFLGQTGFGKSSLINSLFGSHFNTDPLVSCTKELYSVMTIEESNKYDAIIAFDTPGIGEFSNNSQYQLFYNYAVSQANHIVLVVSMDRTDTTSQDLLLSVKDYVKSDSVKFTIALNRIDSAGVDNSGGENHLWDSINNVPSELCLDKIERRLSTIKMNFGEDIDFLPFEVIPVCALRNYGIDNLKKRIMQ